MKFLITGITGTAGEAFVKELYPKYEIVGVDRNENRVARMKYYYPKLEIHTGDFSEYRFQGDEKHILHLAAMKHIDQCERNPREAVIQNVVKTHKLLENALNKLDWDNFTFTYMSTDKACDPASIYGYTKYLAEKLVLGYNVSMGPVTCMTHGVIRSGNIYGSNGSVVPLWREAISKGKPIMLTDDSMKRYFITPEHLAKQVTKNVLLSDRAPIVYIPEMDKHVTMGEVLDDVLAEKNYNRDNYPGGIIVTGLRPGEKMEEALHAL